jgi:hypothetical protein
MPANPGKAARSARARRRADWRAEARNETEYKRLVRQLEPDPGRQGRLEQTYALDQRLGRLQRRGVREATIGRVTYRLNPLPRRNPRRRRNPIAKGELIDLVIPLVALWLLIRSGRLRPGA